MIELKLTLRFKDTALSTKATGGTPLIVLDQMNDIIKELKNLDLQNFWSRTTSYASDPILKTAHDLEKQEIKKAAEPKVKIYKVVNKDGKNLICKYCGGIISWDLKPERNLPLHCNELGQIVGDGDCHGYQ